MLGSDWFSFPRLNLKVLNVKSGGPDLGSDWLTGGGVRAGDFQGLIPQNFTKWGSLGSSFPPSQDPRTDTIMSCDPLYIFFR